MNMHRASEWRVVILLISALFAGGAGEALAQSAQSPFEPGSVSITPSIGFALDPDADVSLAVAGGVAYPIGSWFAVEGELGHLFDLAPSDADVDSSLTTVHGSLLYLIRTPYVLTPYLAAGLGIGRFSLDTPSPSAPFRSTEVGVNLGGGVAYPLRDDIWLRGDVRYFNHIDDVPAAWRFNAGLVLRVGQ